MLTLLIYVKVYSSVQQDLLGCHVSTVGSLPGFVMATTTANAIKNRASNEEILTILKEVPNPNQDEDDGTVSSLVTF